MLRGALPFLEQPDQAVGVDEITLAIERAFGNCGFEYFTFHDFPDPERYADFVFSKRVPDEWFKLYVQNEYNRIDPAFRLCRRSAEAFIWADAPYNADEDTPTAKFVQRVLDFGLARGLLIPIPRTSGRLGVVWVGGPHAELGTLPHPAPTFSWRSMHLSDCAALWEPLVTLREREVLTWVAQGKSAWAIGEILIIAKRTYVRRRGLRLALEPQHAGATGFLILSQTLLGPDRYGCLAVPSPSRSPLRVRRR
jgi:LuxR family quorum sensing-dependent transcriptional regulator